MIVQVLHQGSCRRIRRGPLNYLYVYVSVDGAGDLVFGTLTLGRWKNSSEGTLRLTRVHTLGNGLTYMLIVLYSFFL